MAALVLFLPGTGSDVHNWKASEQAAFEVVIIPDFKGGRCTRSRVNLAFYEKGSEDARLSFIGEVAGCREDAIKVNA